MLRVRLHNAAALSELREALAQADFSTAPIDATTLLVTHPLSPDEDEARVELTFFLRAWEGAHPGTTPEVLR